MLNLKHKLKKNELTVGSWITLGAPTIAEIMARQEFDWLVVDMEHSAISLPQAQQLIQIIELSGVVPLVRVGENNPLLIKRVMDAGAQGVVVPMVNSRQSAMQAVAAVQYPPKGMRGVGLGRALGYGESFESYKKWNASSSVVIAQIEHIKAIENLEGILTVDGIDATIIGPYDLSASLGYPGKFNHPSVKDALKRYAYVCKKLQKPMGIHVISPEIRELKKAFTTGYKFVARSLDTLFLIESLRDGQAEIRQYKKKG